VVTGWALETTRRAATTDPSSSSAPAARPPRTWTRRTAAPARISAPAARAALASAWLTPPMPPCTHPQAPSCPATWPIQWCISTYADPGLIGPHQAPMMACVASAPLTRSSVNHSSRKSAADMVNSRTASATSRPVHLRSRAAAAAHLGRSPADRFGGTTNSRSFSSRATRAKYRSNSTYEAASAAQNFAISAASRAVSPHSVSPDPSGNGTK
jgi:hypothetical protein